MKYFAVVGMLMLALTGFAQEETAYIELKNEGNEALRSNDFAGALSKYEAALAVWPEEEAMDGAMVYNLATSETRSKTHEKALQYPQQSLALVYSADFPTYYEPSPLNNLGGKRELEEVLVEALEAYRTAPFLAHMKKRLV